MLPAGAVADYESVLARAAIDAGADVVLGHHQHIIKPIEIYRGRAIFHGMGNFAMDVYMEQTNGESEAEGLSRFIS